MRSVRHIVPPSAMHHASLPTCLHKPFHASGFFSFFTYHSHIQRLTLSGWLWGVSCDTSLEPEAQGTWGHQWSGFSSGWGFGRPVFVFLPAFYQYKTLPVFSCLHGLSSRASNPPICTWLMYWICLQRSGALMTRRLLAPHEQDDDLWGCSDGAVSTSIPAGLIIEDLGASMLCLSHQTWDMSDPPGSSG